MRFFHEVTACAMLLALCALLSPARPCAAADEDPRKQAAEEAQLRLLLGDASQPIGPGEEALASLKGKLDKVIKVQFLDTPLDRVIDVLQRESGVTILLDRKAIGTRMPPVQLEAEKMSLKDALDWACLSSDTDWDVVRGVIVVSSRNAIQRRQVVTRVYDIRGLVIQIPSFTEAPEFDLNQALSNTSSGGSSGGAATASTTLFAEEATTSSISRAESVEQLVTAIQDTIGKQADWAAYGGELSSIKEITGNLIVRTTARNHQQIDQFLKQMSQNQERMVHLDARYLLVKSKVLEELIKKNDGQFTIAADKVEGFLKAAGDAAAGSKRLGAARMVQFNGQRTYMNAANQAAFLSDLEPVTGSGGVDPTVSILSTGTVMDVEATVAQEGKSIVMTVRSHVITGKAGKQSDIPAGGVNVPRQDEVPARAPAPGEAAPAPKPKAPPAGYIPPAVVKLDLPEQDIVRLVTSVSIPNGGAVILTGASTMIKSVNTEDADVVLIIQAKSK